MFWRWHISSLVSDQSSNMIVMQGYQHEILLFSTNDLPVSLMWRVLCLQMALGRKPTSVNMCQRWIAQSEHKCTLGGSQNWKLILIGRVNIPCDIWLQCFCLLHVLFLFWTGRDIFKTLETFHLAQLMASSIYCVHSGVVWSCINTVKRFWSFAQIADMSTSLSA